MKPVTGTELKINVHLEPIGGLTMDNYDFSVVMYTSPFKEQHFAKADMTRVDENNYIALVDSAKTGAGELKCMVTALIPDEDFPDGLRTEKVCGYTGVTIVSML